MISVLWLLSIHDTTKSSVPQLEAEMNKLVWVEPAKSYWPIWIEKQWEVQRISPPPLWSMLSASTYCTNDPVHAVQEAVNRPLTNLFLRSRYREKWRLPIESILATNKIKNLGRPPWLCGFVCAYHPAAPGSNPKHAIFAFFTLYECNIEIVMRKGEKVLAHKIQN